ncbi:uncharacterized protein, partial [Dermacentor albipictus]|uniref:uncharacterized protein n=1 Tax=Dermacentor albipictus TaxID=60249 RepID=UPI0038FCD916
MALTNHFIFLVQVLGSLLPYNVCIQDHGPASLLDVPFTEIHGTQRMRTLSGAALDEMDWRESAPYRFTSTTEMAAIPTAYKWSNLSIVGIGHGRTAVSMALTNHFIFLVQVLGSLLPYNVCIQDHGPASLLDVPFTEMHGTQRMRTLSGAALDEMDWRESAPYRFTSTTEMAAIPTAYKLSNLSIVGIGHGRTAVSMALTNHFIFLVQVFTANFSLAVLPHGLPFDDVCLELFDSGSSSSTDLFEAFKLQQCPAGDEFGHFPFPSWQHCEEGVDAVKCQLQKQRSSTVTMGRGTGEMAVTLTSFLLLTQVFTANFSLAVLPHGLPFDDVCLELFDSGSSSSTDLFEAFKLQQCPAGDEFGHFPFPSWQHCEEGVDAVKCQLQKQRSSTVTMGRGTGEMAVTLTSFLLLTQVFTANFSLAVLPHGLPFDDVCLELFDSGSSSSTDLFEAFKLQQCPAGDEFGHFPFPSWQHCEEGVDAVKCQLQKQRSSTVTMGRGTGEMAVTLTSFLLLTQVFTANFSLAVLPYGLPFDDVCLELFDSGSSSSTDLFEAFKLQQCPAGDEFGHFPFPSWQHCEEGVDAVKCQLQKQRSSTVTMGRGTGEMAVTLTSFLLLTQVFTANFSLAVLPHGLPFDDVCLELFDSGSSSSTDLFEAFKLQQCPAGDEFGHFPFPSWQHCEEGVDAVKCQLQKQRSSTVTMGRGTGEMAVTLTSFLLLTQVFTANFSLAVLPYGLPFDDVCLELFDSGSSSSTDLFEAFKLQQCPAGDEFGHFPFPSWQHCEEGVDAVKCQLQKQRSSTVTMGRGTGEMAVTLTSFLLLTQ